MSYTKAMQQYNAVATDAAVNYASPYRLIQMLFEAALGRIAAARGHMERGEIAAKGVAIGKAISIVAGLRKSLNHEAGGEIAANLERLYDYYERRLLEANTSNDPRLLDEVTRLLGEIKSAWDQIGEGANGPSVARAPRLDPIGDGASAPSTAETPLHGAVATRVPA
jgi:flagellar protein FliS